MIMDLGEAVVPSPPSGPTTMPKSDNIVSAAGSASLIAGPSFMLFAGMFRVAGSAGHAWDFDVQFIPAFVLLLLFSMFIGMLLAFPVCAIAGAVLARVGDGTPHARTLPVWLLAAAAIAIMILCWIDTALLTDFGGPFAATAVVCAWIMHGRLHWD